MPLLYLCLSLLLGIFSGSVINVSLWTLIIPLLAIVPAFFLPRFRRLIILSCLCLLVFLGGAFRYQSSIPVIDETRACYYNDNGKVRLEGVITDFPEVKKSTLSFRFAAESLIQDKTKTPISGDIQVFVPFYRQFSYGDHLIISGELATPQQFEDFDYREYLVNQGIYSVMYYPAVEGLESTSGFMPLSWLNHLRNRLADSLTRCLPEPQCSLAHGILLGLRGSIPASMMEAFYVTGTTHLLAISGINLTIIMGIILFSAIWIFGRQNRIYICISLSLIWLYALLTGMPPTVARAAIMGSVFLLAETLGRQRNIIVALSLAAALMVMVEPRLLWDTSFQLSFVSMLGLAYIQPYFTVIADNTAKSGKNNVLISLRKIITIGFGTTLAAILATWPLIALNFHSFSLVSIPATFFAMPAFPGIILISFFTSVAGLFWQPLGTLFGYISWLFIGYFLLILQIFSAIPGIYLSNISLQPWQAVVYYLILAAILLAFSYRNQVAGYFQWVWKKLATMFGILISVSVKKCAVWLLVILLLGNMLAWLAMMSLPDGKLHVYMLDVGQGDAILIRTPSGQNILIDTGPDPRSAVFQVGNQLPFWDRTIDFLILTQPQADHIAGSLQLMKSYRVKNLAVVDCSSTNPLFAEIISVFNTQSGEVLLLSSGKHLSLGEGISLKVLNPPEPLLYGTADDINNNSLVMRLSWNDVSFLFTADIEEEAEQYLLENRAELDSDVLKVAHHGSRGASSDSFLAVVSPVAAVISVGADNRFGHPHSEVIQRLKNCSSEELILQTSIHGTVEFITNGDSLWYRIENQ